MATKACPRWAGDEARPLDTTQMNLRHIRWMPVAVAAGAIYLLWRALTTLDGVPRWLAWPALTIEIVGWVGLVVWLVVLRPGGADLAEADQRATPLRADVFVRLDAHPLSHLLATLAGVRNVRGVESTSLLVTRHRPDVLAVAAEHGLAVFEVDQMFDAAGLTAALAGGSAPWMMVLDAGDVPRPDVLSALAPRVDDPYVAAVVGRVGHRSVESVEHDQRGRHERRFERELLGPATSPAALIGGSGTVMRRWAVARVGIPTGSRRGVEMRLSARLRAAGLAVIAPPDHVVVRERGAASAVEVRATRRRETAGALELLRSTDGPLLSMRMRLADRLALAAGLVRPLSGLRRAVFLAVLMLSMVSGRLPLSTRWWELAVVWLPAAASAQLALRQLVGGRLAFGEQARWSFATVGAALAALGGPGRQPIGAELSMVTGWRARMTADRTMTATMVGLAVTMAAVMASDRRGGPLPTMEPVDRALQIGVALWSIVLVLAVLRCLPGSQTARRSARVRIAEPGRVGDYQATICDLTPFGAGAVIEGTDLSEPIMAGEHVRVSFAVPTRRGRRTLVTASAVVRTARRTPLGYVCGLEFADLDFASSDALYEYCEVVSPEGTDLVEPTTADVLAVPGPRRLLVRTAAIAALLAAVAATAPSVVDAASPAGAPAVVAATDRMVPAAVCLLAVAALVSVVWAMLRPSVRDRPPGR